MLTNKNVHRVGVTETVLTSVNSVFVLVFVEWFMVEKIIYCQEHIKKAWIHFIILMEVLLFVTEIKNHGFYSKLFFKN